MFLLSQLLLLADRCNATFGYFHNMSSVVCLWRECIVIKRLQLGSWSLKCSLMPYLFARQNWWQDSKGPLGLGLKVGWQGFRLRYAVSWKRCKIALRWQSLIGSRMWAFDRNNSRWPSMTLNAIHCSVVSFMRVVTKRLGLESRRFHCKV